MNTIENQQFYGSDVIRIDMNPNGIPIKKILTSAFMEKYTNFFSFRELTFSSLVWIDWNQPIVLTRRSLLDEFVSGSSQFSSWDEMFSRAMAEYNE